MSRINTNVPSLIARSNLQKSAADLQVRLQRLSTGLRINTGADDPAGLIISERLKADIAGTQQGIDNSDRASSVIATADGALSEVSDLLSSIKSLIVQSANTGGVSDEERAANQLQIDSAIDSITRISNTASFGGLKLLNGSLDYNLSGVSSSQISNASIFGASFIGSSQLKVDVDVLASAQHGALFVRGDYPASPAGNGTILSTTTLRIAGAKGVSEITVVSHATLSDLAAAVNTVSQLTGVTARLVNPNDMSSGLVFQSSDFGSSQFVSVDRLNAPTSASASPWQTYQLSNNAAVPSFGPPFDWSGMLAAGTLSTATRDDGKDVSALINGTLATGDGLSVSMNSPSLSLKLILSQSMATDPSSGASSFYITGGGALFQLGPDVIAQQQTNLGIQSVAASSLGGTLNNGVLEFLSSIKSGQDNSLASSTSRNDFTAASSILDSAINDVSVMRGRLGAFEKNVLQTNVSSLQTALQNLSSSESDIADADFASETSALTRDQILQSAGTTVLGLANQSSQQVLQLLG